MRASDAMAHGAAITMACINGCYRIPYCADTGANVNILSRTRLRELQACDASAREVELDRPVGVDVVGGHIVATHAVDVYVALHTAAGPVRFQDKKRCLIIDCREDELIVGRPTLCELGIDIDRLLEALAGRRDDGDDDPIELEDEPRVWRAHVDMHGVINDLVAAAVANGFPDDRQNELRELCLAFDIWRCELGNDPPAKVEPMVIRLKDGAQPYKCRARTYAPEKSTFMKQFNNELVRLGWIYENPTSRWACPALPVRKANGEYRQTADYRPINALTETIAGVMPNVQVALERCRGKKYFAVFDFLKGFWQLPLATESQECLSYMTDIHVYTPTRVPQGSADAALHFQAVVENVMGTLMYKSVLVWIDDLLMYAETIDGLLHVLRDAFERLDAKGLKLSPKKSKLFLTEVKWCGRMISAAGIGHDPTRIQALQQLPPPTNAAELQQFVCATGWMRESLVDYARIVAPLQDRLDAALAGRRRTKASAAHVPVQLNDREMQSFDAVKELLSHSVKMAFPEPDKQMCLLADASDYGWGLIVTQVTDWQQNVPIQNQKHQLLASMGGLFRGSQLQWTVLEKEMYPLARACDRLEWLLLRPQGVKVYCDHRNLVLLFVPNRELKKHVSGKLLRWSLKLAGIRYEIEHIEGTHNVWADLISRWGSGRQAVDKSETTLPIASCSQSSKMVMQVKAVRAANSRSAKSRIRPIDSERFVWPTLDEIRKLQELHRSKEEHAVRDDNGTWRVADKIWIPPDSMN